MPSRRQQCLPVCDRLDRLAASLAGAGTVLMQEKQSRLTAENERLSNAVAR